MPAGSWPPSVTATIKPCGGGRGAGWISRMPGFQPPGCSCLPSNLFRVRGWKGWQTRGWQRLEGFSGRLEGFSGRLEGFSGRLEAKNGVLGRLEGGWKARDILKKTAAYFAKDRREVLLHCEAPGDLAGGLVVRGARCLARWVLCLADATPQSAQPNRCAKVRASFVARTAPGGCGKTFWQKGCRAACIALSG